MITLTMRHTKGQSLRTLWTALAKAWGAVTSGAAWKAQKARYGVTGYCRVVEVTYGANGWHVHVHALLFLERQVMDATADQLGEEMFGRWSAALVRAGLRAPLMRSGGMDAQVAYGDAERVLSEYFTKGTYTGLSAAQRLAMEATRGGQKLGRGENRTPFQLLASVYETGDADDLDAWHEYERVSQGKRQLTWSVGMRKELALAAEVEDEAIAAAEVGTERDDLVRLDGKAWRQLRSAGRRPGAVLAGVLLAAESDADGLTLCRALDALGVGYTYTFGQAFVPIADWAR